METKIVEYKLSALLEKGSARNSDEEKVAYGEYSKLNVIAASPFLHEKDIVVRAVVYADGMPAAAEYRWPVDVEANGRVFQAESGGESFSVEKYRKYSVGLDLWMRPLSAPNYISIGCGMSKIAQKILTRLGRTMFYIPRRVGLFKSRSVCEIKLSGLILRLASFVVDICLKLWWTAVECVCSMRLCGLSVVEVKPEDAIRLGCIEDIIAQDGHRFKEVHNLAWIKWHINYAMHDGGPARLYAWEKCGKMVGFCMLKKKFYPQASTRGFRNVWLGSVIEWGVNASSRCLEKWIVLAGAMILKKDHCDAAEVVTSDVSLGTLLRRVLFLRVGDGNFGVTVGKQSPLRAEEGWEQLSNWRFRPAMCDNGIG